MYQRRNFGHLSRASVLNTVASTVDDIENILSQAYDKGLKEPGYQMFWCTIRLKTVICVDPDHDIKNNKKLNIRDFLIVHKRSVRCMQLLRVCYIHRDDKR